MKRLFNYFLALFLLLSYTAIFSPYLKGMSHQLPITQQWWNETLIWLKDTFFTFSPIGLINIAIYLFLPWVIQPSFVQKTIVPKKKWITFSSRTLAVMVGLGFWVSWDGLIWLGDTLQSLLVLGEKTVLGIGFILAIIIALVIWSVITISQLFFEDYEWNFSIGLWATFAILLPVAGAQGVNWAGRAFIFLALIGIGAWIFSRDVKRGGLQSWIAHFSLYLGALTGLAIYLILTGPLFFKFPYADSLLTPEWWAQIYNRIFPISFRGMGYLTFFLALPLPYLIRRLHFWEGVNYFWNCLFVAVTLFTFPFEYSWYFMALIFTLFLTTSSISLSSTLSIVNKFSQLDFLKTPHAQKSMDHVFRINTLVWIVIILFIPYIAFSNKWWGWGSQLLTLIVEALLLYILGERNYRRVNPPAPKSTRLPSEQLVPVAPFEAHLLLEEIPKSPEEIIAELNNEVRKIAGELERAREVLDEQRNRGLPEKPIHAKIISLEGKLKNLHKEIQVEESKIQPITNEPDEGPSD